MNHVTVNLNFVFPANDEGEMEFSIGQGEEVEIDDDTVMDEPEGMEVTSPVGPEHAVDKRAKVCSKRKGRAKARYGFVHF